MKNSRAKGANGEREWAKYLNDKFGLQARRGQQFSGSTESPDVVGSWPNTHPEVKRVEGLSLYPAMEQARRDAGENLIPYVAHRRNNKDWLVIVPAERLLAFCRAVINGTREPVKHFQLTVPPGVRLVGTGLENVVETGLKQREFVSDTQPKELE